MDAAFQPRRVTSSRAYLEHASEQFELALEARLRAHFPVRAPDEERFAPLESPPADDLTPYGCFVREHDLDDESQMLVMLALAPSPAQ